MSQRRVPCPACKAPIVDGARKCRACKAWLVPEAMPRAPKVILGGIAVAGTLFAAVVGGRESPVGEAPPLTALTDSDASTQGVPRPGAIGPEVEAEPEPPPPPDPNKRWKTREIRVGEVHPLDVLFHPKGTSVYVSADDATLREYKLKNGEIAHQASMPAQGDEIRMLFDRYVAVLRHEDAARVPVMDTTAWNRDPVLLDVGRSPGQIVAMPDGRTVVAATIDGKRVARFDLPTGVRLSDITLPHATGQLFLVRAEGRPYLGALGALTHGGRAAGAWIDLFDPSEEPFGATRRSVFVGRDPRVGAVSHDGGSLFFPDRVSNKAVLLDIAATTQVKSVAVGLSPEQGFFMGEDRYGVTLDSKARTATVIELETMKVKSTLMLDGAPCGGAASPDGRILFVTLGGTEWPPKGSGVAVIAGDPPKVVATLPTGLGACAVDVSRDGARAVVASYYDKSVTIVEQ
ncbi:YncE family protein [Polyangium aurulentum]|uniref:YncE family protein n=1 Tax=Polyangium aurulentum TaxID=2567896 RepID=UPI0010ADAD11|nr:hypothetical protein [Polyangium aurulentum]UQA60101.1 hypothetical protein E8A73_006345 [Polyangium aurulentum]